VSPRLRTGRAYPERLMGVEPKPSISEYLLRVYGDDAHLRY